MCNVIEVSRWCDSVWGPGAKDNDKVKGKGKNNQEKGNSESQANANNVGGEAKRLLYVVKNNEKRAKSPALPEVL